MTDRVMNYPASVPPVEDILRTNRYDMIGLGMLALDLLGQSTIAAGFAATATTPASLNVQIAPGRLYSLQNVDNTPYSTLAIDTAHQILKQGLQLDPVSVSCPAPTTFGFSQNYLIQAAYQDSDTDFQVLQYYNVTNPNVPFNGVGNLGASQPTTRKGIVVIQAKAGAATVTGTQLTPSPDPGFVGLWVVTVANGQSTITAGNITQASGAPFLSANGAVHGSQRFTSSGTFVVPPGVAQLYVSGCAGGGGGAGAAGNNGIALSAGGGGGGSAGQAILKMPFAVTAGQSIAITIGVGGAGGAGGAAGVTNGSIGGQGGATIIGSLITLTLGGGAAAGANGGGSIGAGGLGGGGFPNGSAGADGQGGGFGGAGASAAFGGGGGTVRGVASGAGIAGVLGGGFGTGGGGGSACYGAATGAGGAGGAGAPGFALIEW